MNDSVQPLRGAAGAIARAPSPLSATRLSVDIDDLLASIELEQDYENRESQAIEASYTLALPQGACLLDVRVRVGEAELRGRVEPARQAEARYEQALAEGHAAYTIRLVDDHLLNLSLGNLLPGEKLTISVRMGVWLSWNGERVRLTLPTTLAPRYGKSRLQPPDQPLVDLMIENGFRLDGSVRGLLAGAELSSATHRLAVRAVDGGLGFSIERGLMDRDIVLDLRDRAGCARIAALADADLGGRHATMLSFCADGGEMPARALVAEIVVDCSGSMGGISIEQTRAAVRAMLARMGPQDRVNVLRFGSTHRWLLRRPQPATPAVLKTLAQGADELQADLGGTELLAALNAGLDDLARLPEDIPGERVLFVISDGEVWNLDTEALLRRCAAQGVRIYAVAVGTAAVEATFAPLVRATGGALERVLPSDAMAARIERHFARMRCGALRELAVEWPGAVHWQQGPVEVHAGDGVVLAAGLDTIPERLTVRWRAPDGAWQRREIAVRATARPPEAGGPSTLARLLARERLAGIQDHFVQTRMAVDYQLVSEYTSITMVRELSAAQRQQQLPETRQVPQMLAAGWGGVGIPAAEATDMACFARAGAPPADVYDDISFDFDLQGESSEDAAPGAPQAAPPPRVQSPAPVQADQGLLARAAAKVRGLVAGKPDLQVTEKAVRHDPEAALRAELIALLLQRLSADPGLRELHRRNALSLDALGLALSTTLFNWLDARAEAEGCGLEDGAFWRRLIDELCAGEGGAELRARWGGA